MQITVVTETFPPEVNGVARTLRRWIDGLRARGHRIDVVRPRQSLQAAKAIDRSDGVDEDHNPAEARYLGTDADLLVRGTAFPMYPEMRFGWPSARLLVRHWQQQPPDLVHIVTEGPLGWSALRAADRLGLPVVSSFHTNFHQYSKYYGYGFLLDLGVRYLRWFHNRTRCTMVPSPDSRIALEERGFERLIEVGRGVDTERFGPKWRSEELRKQWGAGPQDPVILYVGRLAEEKNIDLVARAMEETIRSVPGSRGVLVGAGPAGKSLGRNHPDLVYCGLRQGEDLAAHYASGDLLVFPSLSETFGNVVLEAMASGIAPVAYDCAAAGLHIHDGENGLVLPPGDEEALVTATRVLASDLGLARRLGASARASTLSLSWDRIVDRLESVLLAALDSSPGHSGVQVRHSGVA